MSAHRGFARDALVVVLVGVGIAAAPEIAAAQSQGSPNQPVAVPYAGGGSPVDQQALPPAPPNYAPPRNDRSTYQPPPAPPSGYDRSDDDRYTDRDNRDYRADPPPPSDYNAANDQRNDGRYGDPRSDYGPPPERCLMVEQRTFFPDDTTQRNSVRACRSPNGRWRIVE